MLTALIIFLAPLSVSAHEAYVVPPREFHAAMAVPGYNPFLALRSAANLRTFILITAGVILGLLVVEFLDWKTGRRTGRWFERAARAGAPALRIVAGISLLASAWLGVFLGPELPLTAIGNAFLLRMLLAAAGILLVFGIAAEAGALIALGVFAAAVRAYGLYMGGYLNYAGEFAALLFIGAGAFALERFFLRERRNFFKRFEPDFIRVMYGLALAWAAVAVKFLHPALTLSIVRDYNLTRFHWLFPHDPALVVLGASLAELAIGILIVLGLELRATVLLTLVYITLSLLYFGEAVWPHAILYGLSFYLLVVPQRCSIDSFLRKRFH